MMIKDRVFAALGLVLLAPAITVEAAPASPATNPPGDGGRQGRRRRHAGRPKLGVSL